MLTQRWANIAFTTVLLIACAYFAMEAEKFETSGLLATSGLPSKFFPRLLLAFVAVCSLIVLYLYGVLGGAGGDAEERVFEDAAAARRGVLMLAVAILSYVIWMNFGFIAMAVLMGPASLLAMGNRNPWIYGAVLVLTGLIYLVFTRLLGISLV